MVAGDLVNTASRDPAAAEPGHGLRRRDDAAGHRADDRVTRTRACTRSRARRSRASCGRRSASSPASRGTLSSTGLEAPFVGRDRELRQVKELFHTSADERQGASRVGDRHRRDRQVAARLGVLQVLRRDRRETSTGIAAAASPTARASPTGLSPTWCGCAAGSSRTRSPRSAPQQARGHARRSTSSTPTSARSSSRDSPSCSGSGARGGATGRTSSPPGASSSSGWPRSRPDGARLRGPAVGRLEPARLRRAPARLVAQPPALRAHARPAGAASTAARRGARAPQLQHRCTSSRSRPRRWRQLLDGLVPGLPAELREQILARAEGVPLYAVETVRMLLDRGALVAGGRRSTARSARSTRSRCRRPSTR